MTLDWPAIMRSDYIRACHVIARLMPSSLRPAYDAEDFVGEAMKAVLLQPSLYRNRNSLILLAKRRMIDAFRSPRVRVQRLGLDEDLPDQRPPVSIEYDAAELRQRLVDWACRPRTKRALELRCDGYDCVEIATRTGIKTRTIQRLMRRVAKEFAP